MLKIISLIIIILISALPLKANINTFKYEISSLNKYVLLISLDGQKINLKSKIADDSKIIINYPDFYNVNQKETRITASRDYLNNDYPNLTLNTSLDDIFSPLTITFQSNNNLTINPYTNNVRIQELITVDLNDDERMIIDIPSSLNIGNTYVDIKINSKYLYKDDILDINIYFKEVEDYSTYHVEIPYSIKTEKYIEKRIAYAYKEVTAWDMNHPLASKPTGLYKEITQYAYQEILSYSKDNYVLTKPNNPYYKEEIQYGRSSKQYYAIYKKECNNGCPIECNLNNTYEDENSNKYCLIYVNGFDGKPNGELIASAEWRYIVFDNDWRFDTEYEFEYPYIPEERIVYLLPDKISEIKGIRDTPYDASNAIIPITLKRYVVPMSYSELSTWSFEKPNKEDVLIYQKEMFRYKNEDGTYSNWQ